VFSKTSFEKYHPPIPDTFYVMAAIKRKHLAYLCVCNCFLTTFHSETEYWIWRECFYRCKAFRSETAWSFQISIYYILHSHWRLPVNYDALTIEAKHFHLRIICVSHLIVNNKFMFVAKIATRWNFCLLLEILLSFGSFIINCTKSMGTGWITLKHSDLITHHLA